MSKMTDQLVSIICPLSHDSPFINQQIERIYEKCRQNFDQFEIILVLSGLADSQIQSLFKLVENKSGMRALRLTKRLDFDIAATAGLDSCIGDYVLIFDLTTDPVDQVAHLVELSARSGSVVLGVRKSTQSDGLFTRVGRRLFYGLARKLELNLIERTTYLCVIPRKAVTFLSSSGDKSRYIKLITTQIGARTVNFEYDFAREAGLTSRSFWSSVDLSVRVMISQSRVPLRWAAILALALSGLNGLLTLGLLGKSLFSSSNLSPHWSLSLQVSLSLSGLFLILAVFAEYLALMISQGRSYPQYYVLEEKNSQSAIGNSGKVNVLDKPTV